MIQVGLAAVNALSLVMMIKGSSLTERFDEQGHRRQVQADGIYPTEHP